jgi:pteridine reductase
MLTSSTVPAILVTGAAKRVGAAITRTLHAAGANLIIHCNRSRADADALAKELNAVRAKSASVVQGDLLAYNALKGLVVHAASEFGRLDGLVNNASAFYPTPVGQIDEDNWTELIDSNLKAPLFLSQAAAPYLKKNGGSIVNIVDIHAERPLKDFVVYTIAKAGLAGLTRSLALSWARRFASMASRLAPSCGPTAAMTTRKPNASALSNKPRCNASDHLPILPAR